MLAKSGPLGAGAYVLALGDGIQVDLDLGHGQDIGGRGHVDEKLCIPRASAPPMGATTTANGHNVPWTVLLAPAAVMAPMAPTMK